MLAEIGLVGKAIGRYNLYAGGNCEGPAFRACLKKTLPNLKSLKLSKAGWQIGLETVWMRKVLEILPSVQVSSNPYWTLRETFGHNAYRQTHKSAMRK